MNNLGKKSKLDRVLLIILLANLIITCYLAYQNNLLKKEKLVLEDELSQTRKNFASTTEGLQGVIDSVQWELEKTRIERDNFETRYNLEKSRMDALSSQIGGIESIVDRLEKLSKTDPELLKKYSKVYFLSENFIPSTFIKIEPRYTYKTEEDYLIYSEIWPFLEEMLKVAGNASPPVDIKIISAYRSFGKQAEIKSSYSMIYGSGANRFSADQGYSEHQLGTALDFTDSQVGDSYSNFDKTPAYEWLVNNAYKYGFILSYPENNIYYQYEPWHWRFVGRELANKLKSENKNFYDLDQREIDKYLISFFD